MAAGILLGRNAQLRGHWADQVVGERDVEVLRILHERMDPGLHLDDED